MFTRVRKWLRLMSPKKFSKMGKVQNDHHLAPNFIRGDIVNMEKNEGAVQNVIKSQVEEATCPCLVLRKSKDDELRMQPPKVIELKKPCVTIGRAFNVDYCIVSKAISRTHCEIKSCSDDSTDGWEITDRSGNGVFINGTKIERDLGVKLRDRDVVDLASNEDPVVSYVFQSNVKDEQATYANCKRLKPEVHLLEPTQSTSLAGETSQSAAQDVGESVTPERLELRRKNDDLAVEVQLLKATMMQQEILLRQRWELEQEEKRKSEEARAEACKKEDALEEEKWQQRLAELNAKHTMALEEKNQLADRLKSMCEDKSKEAEIEKDKTRLEEELQKKDSECSAMKQKLDELTSRNEESATLAIKMRDDLIKNVNDTMETELQCSICSELFVKAATLNCAHSYCSYCINEWKQKKPECPICRQHITSITPSLVLDNFIEKIVDTLDSSMKERRKELLEERKKLPVQNVTRHSVIVIPDTSTQPQAAPSRGRGNRSRRRPRVGTQGRVNNPMHIRPITVQIHTIRGGIVQQRGMAPQQGALPPRGAAPHRGTAVPPRGGMNLPPFPYGIRQPNRPLLEVPLPNPNIVPIADFFSNAPVRPRNPLPHGIQPIEISSESQSDDDDGEAATPYGYYGGHGFCYRCGRSGHWANGCPF